MANKTPGKTYTSTGSHSNVKRSTLRDVARAKGESQKMINQQKAYWAGKNPTITIRNPSEDQLDKMYIRVKANTLWGDPKEKLKNSYTMN